MDMILNNNKSDNEDEDKTLRCSAEPSIFSRRL